MHVVSLEKDREIKIFVFFKTVMSRHSIRRTEESEYILR